MDKTVSIGGQATSFKVSVSLHGDSLNPATLSKMLGVKSTSARSPNQAGHVPTRLRGGYWSVAARTSSDTTINDALSTLLDDFPNDEGLWARLASEYDISVNIAVFLDSSNQDFVLDPSVVRRVASLGASLWVDVYESDEPSAQ